MRYWGSLAISAIPQAHPPSGSTREHRDLSLERNIVYSYCTDLYLEFVLLAPNPQNNE